MSAAGATPDWDDRTALTAAQLQSVVVARAWRASGVYRALVERFDAVAADHVEAVAGAAQRVLAEAGMVEALLAPLVDALAADDWFEPPLRVSRDALRTGAMLFEHPAVSISASLLSAAALAALPPPESVTVSGRLTLVRYVRAGGARLRLWTAEPAGPDFVSATAVPLAPLGSVTLTDGMVLRIDGRTRAARIEDARDDVVTITATVRAATAPFQRDYELPSGKLLRLATTDDGAARTQMLLTFLRHAGRADAGPCFDAATRDGAFFLRWGAMREWLALDAMAALPRLRGMIDDPNAEVRAAAAATLPVVEAACQF